MLSYVQVVYLFVCAAIFVIPLFNHLQCPVSELIRDADWARQRPVMPEPQAELKELCEVGS